MRRLNKQAFAAAKLYPAGHNNSDAAVKYYESISGVAANG